MESIHDAYYKLLNLLVLMGGMKLEEAFSIELSKLESADITL